jgi:hypothetical protein
MSESLAVALGWGIVAIAFFSYLAVRDWANAQRREREAYYRSEAIKKIAEMRGEIPEPVLEALRNALNPPPESRPTWMMSPAQTREYYKGEAMKRIAGLNQADGEALLTVMREEDRRAARRVREGLKIGGLISAVVGIALVVFLHAIVPDMPVFLAGLIPLSVGAVLLVYGLAFAPSE